MYIQTYVIQKYTGRHANDFTAPAARETAQSSARHRAWTRGGGSAPACARTRARCHSSFVNQFSDRISCINEKWGGRMPDSPRLSGYVLVAERDAPLEASLPLCPQIEQAYL